MDCFVLVRTHRSWDSFWRFCICDGVVVGGSWVIRDVWESRFGLGCIV